MQIFCLSFEERERENRSLIQRGLRIPPTHTTSSSPTNILTNIDIYQIFLNDSIELLVTYIHYFSENLCIFIIQLYIHLIQHIDSINDLILTL